MQSDRNNLRLAIKHENAAGIAYQVARHFAKACLPGVRVDPHDAVARRLRPSNVFVNFGIFISAVAWNIVQLPATIRRRKLDHQRSAATARLWKTP